MGMLFAVMISIGAVCSDGDDNDDHDGCDADGDDDNAGSTVA